MLRTLWPFVALTLCFAPAQGQSFGLLVGVRNDHLRVEELQPEKLPVILQLKYKSIPDAARELGDVSRIRETFVGFQKWLYR